MNLPNLNQRPRAIAIDLDGTLLNSQTQLSACNRAALEKCIDLGIPVIIATARPARALNRFLPQYLTENCSLIMLNGGVAIGKIPLSGYFKEPFPETVARRIIKLALELNPHVRVTIELDGYEFGGNWNGDAETLWQRNSATPGMLLSVEEALSRQPCKIALGGDGTDVLKLIDRLENSLGDAISVVPSTGTPLFPPLLNVTSSQATKPSALQKLLIPVGISLAEVIALGDDFPDIGMLKDCGISVAMENSVPEVKAVCSYHTASNDEDGVAIVLERVFLSENSQ
ncbi:MAG: HAD family hydrolase [Chloroflexi bacterium]|nr:HAD family hydrolase [Chloroflexota bacterium]